MGTFDFWPGIAALALAFAHLLAGGLGVLDEVPQRAWFSAAGGISVAYVFVHLLPELAAVQEEVRERAQILPYLEAHAYLLALVGLATFYGLERTARRSRQRRRVQDASDVTSDRVGWLNIVSYGIYNAIIGYLLRDQLESGALALVLFSCAMAVHFLVNDRGLSQHHGDLYKRRGRWIVASAVVAGWGLSLITVVDEAIIGLLVAFLSGGIILNALKEELPEERRSNFGAFCAGVASYAALLLTV